jgi:fructose-1-phosphate kinase PfkB-like protein
MAVDKRISYEDIKDSSIEVEGEIPQDVTIDEEVETTDFEEDATGAMVPSNQNYLPYHLIQI